jgi:predicted transcriptional regulator
MAELHRPDVRVVVRILGVLCEREPRMRPTRLQQASGTNYTQFARYLALLQERGLVKIVEDGSGDRWVEITPRGYEAHGFLMRGIHDLAVGRAP